MSQLKTKNNIIARIASMRRRMLGLKRKVAKCQTSDMKSVKLGNITDSNIYVIIYHRAFFTPNLSVIAKIWMKLINANDMLDDDPIS